MNGWVKQTTKLGETRILGRKLSQLRPTAWQKTGKVSNFVRNILMPNKEGVWRILSLDLTSRRERFPSITMLAEGILIFIFLMNALKDNHKFS